MRVVKETQSVEGAKMVAKYDEKTFTRTNLLFKKMMMMKRLMSYSSIFYTLDFFKVLEIFPLPSSFLSYQSVTTKHFKWLRYYFIQQAITNLRYMLAEFSGIDLVTVHDYWICQMFSIVWKYTVFLENQNPILLYRSILVHA